jgi:hypothetical protein
MTKEFVKYEQALALKELGFDEPCFGYWQGGTNDETTMRCNQGTIYVSDYNTFKNTFPNGESRGMTVISPLYQQAFRWFREKYDLRIRNYGSINYSGGLSEYFEILKYGYGTSDKSLSIEIGALTYEEAELECLRKLIQLVKEKL